jgi:hypothetical protein
LEPLLKVSDFGIPDRLASYSHRCPLGAAIIALVDAEGPKPGPRGPYKKREAENSN